MPTLNAPLTSNSGGLQSVGSPYSTMEAGSDLASNATSVGQGTVSPNYYNIELFWEFDLSALPASAVVTGATLYVYFTANANSSGTDQYEIQPYSWGTSLSTSNWLSPSAIQGLPHYSAWGWYNENSITLSAYNGILLGEGAAEFIADATSGGKLQLVLVSTHFVEGTPPSTSNDSLSLQPYGASNPPYLAITYSYPPPTVTAIGPNVSQLAGGGSAEITGTGFENNSPGAVSVTICGISATGVTVLSDTSLTCTVPASVSAQVGNVVVTTANNGSGTLTNGFTYLKSVDTHVSLIKGGTISGTDHADTSTPWPIAATAKQYGSSTDLWGLTLAPSDVNASNFGVALSANTGTGHSNVESVEVTVYYSTGGNSQPGTYLLSLVTDAGGDTVTPTIYKLPNSGFAPGLDNNIAHAVSGADFYTSRLHLPNRNILKVYRCVEFWCDLSPSSNTPGLQIWAAIDNGSFTQLLDASGNPATVYATGAQRLFFPKNTSGHFVQFDLKVPSLGTGQVPVAVVMRDLNVRVSLRAVLTDGISATLVLGPGEFQDRTSQVLPEPDQLADLQTQLDAGPVVDYTDPVTGETGQMLITALTWQPVVFPGKNTPTLVAHMQARKLRYDA